MWPARSLVTNLELESRAYVWSLCAWRICGFCLGCEEGEIAFAKVFFHCARGRARIGSAFLDWVGNCEPPGHTLSLRHLRDQHHGVRDHRLQPGLPGRPRGRE